MCGFKEAWEHFFELRDNKPIRWVIQQKGITAPIVGAKNPTQVLDNVKACNFVISDEDFKAIDKISQAFAYKLPHFQTFFRA